MGFELLAKVEDRAVRPARTDDVAEAADEPVDAKALRECRDHRLTGKLARTVEGYWQVPEILLSAGVRNVAVNGSARSQYELLDTVQPCRFEGVVGRDRTLLENEA